MKKWILICIGLIMSGCHQSQDTSTGVPAMPVSTVRATPNTTREAQGPSYWYPTQNDKALGWRWLQRLRRDKDNGLSCAEVIVKLHAEFVSTSKKKTPVLQLHKINVNLRQLERYIRWKVSTLEGINRWQFTDGYWTWEKKYRLTYDKYGMQRGIYDGHRVSMQDPELAVIGDEPPPEDRPLRIKRVARTPNRVTH